MYVTILNNNCIYSLHSRDCSYDCELAGILSMFEAVKMAVRPPLCRSVLFSKHRRLQWNREAQ